MFGVFPGPGEATIVKENVALRKHARLAVLFVLLYRIPGFGGADFELAASELGAGGKEGRKGRKKRERDG